MNPAPIAVALDAPDLETAARWATLVTPHVSTVKVGLELYLRYGPDVVASVRGASGVQVFLDLKLHDIPATVAGAARAVARLKPAYLTVHASGGSAMIRAAAEARTEHQDRRCDGSHVAGRRGPDEPGRGGPGLRRRAPAVGAGGGGGRPGARVLADGGRGGTCRGRAPRSPSSRPACARTARQHRTRREWRRRRRRWRSGADLLVIGRPITAAPDPGAAAAGIAAALRRTGGVGAA